MQLVVNFLELKFHVFVCLLSQRCRFGVSNLSVLLTEMSGGWCLISPCKSEQRKKKCFKCEFFFCFFFFDSLLFNFVFLIFGIEILKNVYGR